jgi:nucleoside-diphosphate-sugar epimerase
LKGDCSKAKNVLGWEHDYSFETMLDEMIEWWIGEFSV